MAIKAGPLDPFNYSFSVLVECDDQAEIDRLWVAFSDGGSIEQCGWLRDRWGLCWQITPKRLGELMSDPDPAVGQRVTAAMLTMKKFDIALLESAARGEAD
jgi:predicted 3-demethylubiquinone-9 3-methyltransferase (glyoxalase superfamily)